MKMKDRESKRPGVLTWLAPRVSVWLRPGESDRGAVPEPWTAGDLLSIDLLYLLYLLY